MQGKIFDVSKDLLNGGLIVELSISEDNADYIAELSAEPLLDIEIKKHREKRSNTANGYFWKLVNEISVKLKTDTQTVYNILRQRYGKFEMIPTTADVDNLDPKQFEYCKDGTLSGRPCKWWRYYYSTTTYNTEEFSRLIEGTEDEARQLGIPVLDEAERKALRQ